MELTIDGKKVKAERVSFVPEHEAMSSYLLVDGSRITTRVIIHDVFKLETRDELTGQPNYHTRYSTILATQAEEE